MSECKKTTEIKEKKNESGYEFYAYLDRMKFIRRWQLMRSTREENIMEHSQSVAVLAHALVTIHNQVFGGRADVLKTVLYAMYHETSEVMTGDLPTPIKYFNREIRGAYKRLEDRAEDKLLAMLPKELSAEFAEFVKPDTQSYEYSLVKAADKLSAYVKCLEEIKCGNGEFKKAEQSIRGELENRKLPCLDYFMKNFLPAFSLTLDEMEDL